MSTPSPYESNVQTPVEMNFGENEDGHMHEEQVGWDWEAITHEAMQKNGTKGRQKIGRP